MASGRKAFHFDLDEDKLKAFYPSDSKTGYKGAWAKIQAFMESNDFEHTQYSGYESIHEMEYADAYTVLDNLQGKFPWFKKCARAATLTNIGERHDVLEHFAQKPEHGKEFPKMKQEPPMENRQETSESQEQVTLNSEARAVRAAAEALDEQSGHMELSRDKDVR